jgi:hypothetical protein
MLCVNVNLWTSTYIVTHNARSTVIGEHGIRVCFKQKNWDNYYVNSMHRLSTITYFRNFSSTTYYQLPHMLHQQRMCCLSFPAALNPFLLQLYHTST